jgi:hypothetical protein
MKKIILFLIFYLFLFNLVFAGNDGPVCCQRRFWSAYSWKCGSCGWVWYPTDSSACKEPPPTCQSPGSETTASGTETTGKVTVTWETRTVSICPPAIFGKGPCNFPSLEDLVERIVKLLQAIAAPTLVLLLIIGGLMYLLTPFGVESFIKKGHNYIKYAILGFVILLLVTLIFSTISAILGGPGS